MITSEAAEVYRDERSEQDKRGGYTAPASDGKACRRIHPRLKCKGVAQFRLLPHGSPMPAILVDLSIRGCCIESEQPIDLAPELPVEVLLKIRGTTVRLNGAVRHVSHKTRAGIQFEEVSARKREQIEDLMADLLEMDKVATLEKLTAPACDPRDEFAR